MARRITKAQGNAIAVLILIGFPIYLIFKFFEAFGVGIPLAIGVIVLAAVFVPKPLNKSKRRASLFSKYGDSDVVDRIMSRTIWVGQTSEQLGDSFGAPADVDEKVMKTKRREIWKYAHKGGNRYGMRITVENGEVTGWDERL